MLSDMNTCSLEKNLNQANLSTPNYSVWFSYSCQPHTNISLTITRSNREFREISWTVQADKGSKLVDGSFKREIAYINGVLKGKYQ